MNEIISMEQYLCMLSPELHIWENNIIRPQLQRQQLLLMCLWQPDEELNLGHFQGGRPRRTPGGPTLTTWPVPKPLQVWIGTNIMRKVILVKPNSFNLLIKLICYLCGQEGHIKPMCPNNSRKLCHLCSVPGTNAWMCNVLRNTLWFRLH